MRVLDLFSGTGSSTAAFDMFADTTVFRVELDPQHAADLHADVMSLTAADLVARMGGVPDFVWASPPCTAFSVASIGHHWGGGYREYLPKTEAARLSLELVAHTVALLKEFEAMGCRFWAMENPRGVLRKLPPVAGLFRTTVTYCQYGDTRMKPTDLWRSGDLVGIWTPRPMCRNGAPCHEAAPRGAKTGTQGIAGAVDRSRVPFALSLEIAEKVRAHV